MSPAWAPYSRHIVKLEQFHLRRLRKIAHIKWQDMIPNTTVRECSQISGIEAYLLAAQFRWTGHLIQMNNHRIQKHFNSQLTQGSRTCGGQ